MPNYCRFRPSFDEPDAQPAIDDEELEKQYEVKQVNADQPIAEKFDVLLAVQPSSLSPEQMDNFVAVVKTGIPTAIFEDPFPYLAPGVTASTVRRNNSHRIRCRCSSSNHRCRKGT